MIKGRTKNQDLPTIGVDIRHVLKLAKQSHENYLIKSTEEDLENAIDYYIKAIKIDPTIPEAYYKLASLLWERGEIDINAALEQCQKAIRLNPNSATARMYLGYFLKTAGRFYEAENEFKSSINLSGIFSAKPRIALGITIIQRMRITSPTFADFTKGIYYFFSGMTMLCLDFYALRMLFKSVLEDVSLFSYRLKGTLFKSFRHYEQAIDTYKDAAERTGRSKMFYSEMGDLSIKSGNPNRAVEYYKNALKASPENVVLWAKLANTLQRYYKDNVPDLIECYNHLAELEPDNPRLFYELGHLYTKTKDRFSSVNAFSRASELDPHNAFYHNSLAYSLIQLEDFDGAISEYQKAIRINPDNEWTSVVLQALGAIYHQIKDNPEAAIVAYQSATVLDPKNVDAFISLGEAYHEKKDINNAIDNYCEAIKQNPNEPKVYCNMGLALWEKDYVEEAIVAYQKAVELNPDYDIAYNNLGVVYLDGIGKPDEALASFNSAIKANPNYALAYFNKGRAYQALGKKTDAAEYYQMAININKFTDELDEADVERRIHKLFIVE